MARSFAGFLKANLITAKIKNPDNKTIAISYKSHRTPERITTIKIEINIIVKYGVSIAAVAQNVIDSTKYNVESMTGMNVECVDVCVRSIRL